VYWECTARRGKGARCPATVTQRGDLFTRGRSSHIHEPVAGLMTNVAIKKRIREEARHDMFTPGSAIVSQAYQNLPHANPYDAIPTQNNMVISYCVILLYR